MSEKLYNGPHVGAVYSNIGDCRSYGLIHFYSGNEVDFSSETKFLEG